MSWSVNWYPFPYNAWNLSANGHDYVVNDINSQRFNIDFGTKGAVLLTPQSSTSFKAKLKQLFEQDPSLKSRFSAEEYSRLLAAIDQCDLLSQRLSGFSNYLTGRSGQSKRIPQSKNNSKENPKLGKLSLLMKLADNIIMHPAVH